MTLCGVCSIPLTVGNSFSARDYETGAIITVSSACYDECTPDVDEDDGWDDFTTAKMQAAKEPMEGIAE